MELPLFECDQCGACCRHLIVEIDELDIAREPRLKELAQPTRFDREYFRYEDDDGNPGAPLVPGWEGGGLLVCVDPCKALDPDGRCTIYPTRPNCCVAFRAGSEQCQSARGMAGLEELKPKGIWVEEN